MSILIFAIIVVIVAALGIAIVRSIPNIPSPLNWIIQVAILLLAAILILHRSGVL